MIDLQVVFPLVDDDSKNVGYGNAAVVGVCIVTAVNGKFTMTAKRTVPVYIKRKMQTIHTCVTPCYGKSFMDQRPNVEDFMTKVAGAVIRDRDYNSNLAVLISTYSAVLTELALDEHSRVRVSAMVDAEGIENFEYQTALLYAPGGDVMMSAPFVFSLVRLGGYTGSAVDNIGNVRNVGNRLYSRSVEIRLWRTPEIEDKGEHDGRRFEGSCRAGAADADTIY